MLSPYLPARNLLRNELPNARPAWLTVRALQALYPCSDGLSSVRDKEAAERNETSLAGFFPRPETDLTGGVAGRGFS
jgi:hypothetical protein